MINALDPEQQELALLDYEVSDVVLGLGEDGRTLEPEGIPASELTADQQALLLNLVREWVGIVNDEDAATRMTEYDRPLRSVRSGDLWTIGFRAGWCPTRRRWG